MKLQFHKTLLLSAFLFACPRLILSRDQPISEPKPAQSEAESLVKELASHEQAVQQSCRRIAAIYREMAVPSESDSAAVRKLKRQYERFAENEEKAAATAQRMAAYHARLAALMHRSPDVTKNSSLLLDSDDCCRGAYRR
jgi:septal ring factor EnvC (AmiA/AmiB activator)